ncbi:MAG: prepilin-type N-terminal cleavage/methylation domain-containing protein [Opitutales bacterium]
MHTPNKKGFTLVEIMIVVVIIGLLAAMAIPAFQKVRETSQTKAITNNLRQLASAADQYFIENGVTVAAQTELVGTDKYVKTLNPVAGETYPATITQGVAIEATGGAPGTISVDF